jgi:hypothetical protein
MALRREKQDWKIGGVLPARSEGPAQSGCLHDRDRYNIGIYGMRLRMVDAVINEKKATGNNVAKHLATTFGPPWHRQPLLLQTPSYCKELIDLAQLR